MMFQFTVLVLHVVHFVVQCYFYLRYSYFDPQQNQIDCVQQYAFAGENLTLFLSHPSMCFLSALEAVIIVIVWIQLIAQPGGTCSDTDTSYSLIYAIFTTMIEVYKANLSTAANNFRSKHYLWSVWSLFRLDLFMFYGLTLFLQTFMFPFSLLGHSVVAIRSGVVSGGTSSKHKEGENGKNEIGLSTRESDAIIA
jgi:hypothetical protein